MGFQFIKTYNYRNLVNAQTNLPGETIFLVGDNGQGKTNFLETVYCLCFGAPFRSRINSRLICHGEKEMALFGLLEMGPACLNMAYKLGEKKQITVNDNVVLDRKDLLSHTPCILFCHEDIIFIKGSPEKKRWFLNQTLGLFNPLFLDELRTYNRILKIRSVCLREKNEDMLETLDVQMVCAGLKLMESRRTLIKEFSPFFGEYYRRITGESFRNLKIIYKPSWPQGEESPSSPAGEAEKSSLLNLLKQKRQWDYYLGQSSTGPHRDNIKFLDGGREYAGEASTGQLRLMSLILRIAQAGFYRQKTGKKPILLLDDVLLELDPQKRRQFVESLPEYDQAFFTFLPGEKLLETPRGKPFILKVKEGILKEGQP
ncbi:MAG: DNA replication and repair protein RecF [Spirochaetales bacterium]|jgi:DNA replication and repair protein RecF|nr:DNA replication and repair protein RecF [Spirochaetales bacterium]